MNAGFNDATLHSLIDHIKTVGYSGVTFQITVDADAQGHVINSISITRMLQMLDYAAQQGLSTAVQTNWAVGNTIALDVNDTPATFDVPTFLQGVRTYFQQFAPVAQTHHIGTLYLGYHSDNFVATAYHSQWSAIVSDIHSVYSGELSYIGWYWDYGATFNLSKAFRDIGIWDLVDTIGVELHIPYPTMPLYNVGQIEAGYFYRSQSVSNVVRDPITLSRQYQKPIVFGSLYFMNLNNALDGNDPTPAQAQQTPLPVNSAAQVAAYQGSLEVIAKNLSSFVRGINFSLYEPWVYNTWSASGQLSAADTAVLNSFKYVGALAGPTTAFTGTPAEQLISQYLHQPWGYSTTTATFGSPGDDIIYVTSGNNLIYPNGGQDEVHGGTGTDTVIFPGNSSAYTIIKTASAVIVQDTSNKANVVTAYGISMLQFKDQSFTVSQLVPAHLTNLSVLTDISATVPNFTVGMVVGPSGVSGVKPLLVRAAGPALAQLGVSGYLPDPTLTLNYTSPSPAVVVATNNDWAGTGALSSAFASVGAFPYASANSKDAALFLSGSSALAPGNYTVQVSDASGGNGTVIAEIYDATQPGAFTATTPRLINVSVLKQINAGSPVTAGFVIGGSTSLRVLIRAIGPGLTPLGVGGVMPDPQLTLNNISSSPAVVVATNNDWAGDPAIVAAATKVGAFAVSDSASKDAMLLVTLAPGNYTAQVGPASGTAGGTVIVEVYEVP